MPDLIPKHGGYRNTLSYKLSELIYDITVRFCARYIDKFSRTTDQMVQAARSGKQNIAEGSLASATSKKTELKLTQVARASLEELKLDYEDFLRQKGLTLWHHDNPLRQSLIDARCQTADEVAAWIKVTCQAQNPQGTKSSNQYPEFSANAAQVLITVACSLLDHQVATQAKDFENQGGFTERLYKIRTQKREEERKNK
ncbi:MAG: four helix bundle suffix domain-containing protein [Candidatus Stygibacter frigidus]|nr:four helix bundle suffix domain-containing protein [Candidatus Stygibacter frigidus]